ncbi:MAG: membrane protein insertion efficiency factor YidD [Rhodoglobus sp.]
MNRTVSFLFLAPRNACVGILKVYRAVISPLYGDVCRYYPSCSHYALQAIQHHGVFRGVWFGTKRLARCHPWAEGGIDDIPAHDHEHVAINRFGFVVPIEHSIPSKTFASSHGKG